MYLETTNITVLIRISAFALIPEFKLYLPYHKLFIYKSSSTWAASLAVGAAEERAMAKQAIKLMNITPNG